MSYKGIYRKDNGAVYHGEYQDGQKHGLGVQRMASGNIYKGDYRVSDLSDHGTFHYTDGDVYEEVWLIGFQISIGIATASYVG
jgi:hypothetical protein